MTDAHRRVPTPGELLASWRAEAERTASRPVADAGERDGRVTEARPPWDVDALAREALAGATAVLHLDTGDGATLLRLADALPPDVVASVRPDDEAAARAALEPRGVVVVPLDPGTDSTLPFPADRFDAVLVRQDPPEPRELARVLRPGGVVLADLSAGDDLVDLHAVFGAPLRDPYRTLRRCTEDLVGAGLRVDLGEAWHGPLSFADVGALVAHLTAAPGSAPADFGVDAYANTLHYLHIRGPAWGQPLVFTRSRLLLRARQPR